MRKTIKVKTTNREGLYDITSEVRDFVAVTDIICGLVNVYVRGATAAIMIQENWDKSVQSDVITLLRKLIPQGVWQHDTQDGNGDAHLKSGLIGPSVTIPIADSELLLSTWQNIFLCEFDGPRDRREIVLTAFGN
ncbi:MAG: YjbQ family protein [Deltaproteobacteria bacterium]|nr:YjbQ family protein [Deltaproteobacteria bacterium]